MKRLAALLLLAGACSAADVRYAWLPFSSNVPGAPQTETPVTQYGISVLMDSDNPKATEFQVAITVRLSSGEVRTASAVVVRSPKGGNVQYSTIYSKWLDSKPDFEVLAVQVQAVSGVNVTRPIAGMQYTSDSEQK